MITEIQTPHPLPDTKFRIPLSKVGFPIRKSADQSFFAAPRGLSQRSTSFIASQRQGIHQMPLSHLITLIINAHPSSVRCGKFSANSHNKICNGRWPIRIFNPHRSNTDLERPLFLLQDRTDGEAVKLRRHEHAATLAGGLWPQSNTSLGARRTSRPAPQRSLGTISSSRCQTTRAIANVPWTGRFARRGFVFGRAALARSRTSSL